MAKYMYSQSFNNGTAKNYGTVDCSAVVMQSIIDLMPNGNSVFTPSITGPVGVAVPVPTSYKQFKFSCIDNVSSGMYQTSVVSIKYGKLTVTDSDIIAAALNKVDTPNDTACERVNVLTYKKVG